MELSTLKMGCVVTVTLSSSNRLIGEFNGFKEEPHAIVLKNVRFWTEEVERSTKSCLKTDAIFGELLVESKHIIKLDVLNEGLPKPSTSCVQSGSYDVMKKSMLPMYRTSARESASLSWLPGSKPIRFLYRGDIQKQLQQSMQDYCKKLFDNTNFVQLIPQNEAQPKSLVGSPFPKYFAGFYREPLIPFACPVESSLAQQRQEIVSFQQEFTVSDEEKTENASENHKSLERNACAMIVSELLDETEDNKDAIISVHQLGYEFDNLELHNAVGTEIAQTELSELPHYQLSSFLRFSNGHLYLNETFIRSLCQPVLCSETENNDPMCVDDSNSFAMDCQAIED